MEKEMPEIKIDIDRYRAKEGDKINLKKIATACDIDIDKEAVKTAAFPGSIGRDQSLAGKALCTEYLWAHYRLAGDGCGRQGRDDQARLLASGSEWRPCRFLQAAEQ